MVNPNWRLKFNGGNPVWVDENSTIVRYATDIEIYENMTPEGRLHWYNNMTKEQQEEIDDLFGNPTKQSV